jgi:hypothetical protein
MSIVAESESPFAANVTMIFISIPITLIAPIHGPSGDCARTEGANAASKRSTA